MIFIKTFVKETVVKPNCLFWWDEMSVGFGENDENGVMDQNH